MHKLIGFGTVLLTVLFTIPGASEGQDKKGSKKNDVVVEDATPQDYAALGKIKEIVGKIAAIDVKAGTMTFTLEWQTWELNNNAGKGGDQAMAKLQQQYMREYQQIMQSKNPMQRQQAFMRLQQTMQQAGVNYQKLFHVVKHSKDFDLDLMSTLKVARATMESKYDEQGEIIKYSDEQLKKLKSPDVPGGYIATTEDLVAGQGVKLFLSPPKSKPKDTTESKDGEKTPAGTTVAHPQVRMVLIQTEPVAPDPKSKDDKKKKKN
jgi:hypothetical protein